MYLRNKLSQIQPLLGINAKFCLALFHSQIYTKLFNILQRNTINVKI